MFRSTAFTSLLGIGRGGGGGGGGVDKLALSLTTSLTDYNNATNLSWVKITSSEYTSLLSNVTNTSIAGANSNVIAAVGANDRFVDRYALFTNIVSSNTPEIPANSYLYAVWFRYNGTSSASSVYTNDSITSYTNFSKVGGTLPTTSSGDNYYVLKGSSNTTASTSGNFGMFHSNTFPQAWMLNVGGAGIRYNTPNPPTTSTVLSFPWLSSSAFAMQALTTTSKQW